MNLCTQPQCQTSAGCVCGALGVAPRGYPLMDIIRDPDGPAADRRLLEIRQWCDQHDPHGTTAAGFVVRLMRSAIDARLYKEHGGTFPWDPLMVDRVNQLQRRVEALEGAPRGFTENG